MTGVTLEAAKVMTGVTLEGGAEVKQKREELIARTVLAERDRASLLTEMAESLRSQEAELASAAQFLASIKVYTVGLDMESAPSEALSTSAASSASEASSALEAISSSAASSPSEDKQN